VSRGGVLRLALLAALAAAAQSVAHTGGTTGYASISVERSAVRYTLVLPAAALPTEMAENLRLARGGHANAGDRLLDVVRRVVTLSGDGRRCEPGRGFVQPAATDAPSVTLVVDFACPAGFQELTVRDDIFDELGNDHHTLTRVDWAGETRQFAFEQAARDARFRLAASPARETTSFVRLGIEHILGGWDHLLFLFGLLLRGGSWLALAKIVTAFTLAHSVTLALAVFDVVILPDRLVEAVIALSIAFVAAENLFLRPVVSRRWLVSFCFGLVHGFGFSTVLREMRLPSQGLLLSLLGFNVGVELGQGLVVALAFPALALIKRTAWERRVVWSSSAAILLIGVVLFVERAFF